VSSAESSGDPGAFITIARVLKVQGRRGEVLTELHTDFPERFEQRRTLYAWHEKGERRQLHLESYWPHKGGMVLKFEGVDSIEAAETLLRAEIQISAAERAELEEGTFYISDLTGCALIDRGCEIGRVVDVNFAAGTAPLLIVRGDDGKEFMVPFVESFLRELDLQAKRIETQLPEGMLELDAPLRTVQKKSGAGKKASAASKRKPAKR
jgi:16S rRNA processing protein RimM